MIIKGLSSITNQNDMYLYFEAIRQATPRKVLDCGMFLQRMGALSRQVKDLSFPEEIMLTGVEIAKMPDVKLYETIYDRKVKTVEFCREKEEHYDLVFLLRIKEYMTSEEFKRLFLTCRQKARYLIMDIGDEEEIEEWAQDGQAKIITVNADNYVVMNV